MNQKEARKRLKEMNLTDDFLFTQMVSSPEYGERFTRLLVETLMQRKLGKINVRHQQYYPGADSNLRGTRLDVIIEEETDSEDGPEGEVFDVEPDNDDREKSVKNLPRRIRFYHAKIDARSLSAGSSYDALKNVCVIMILTYDPFGRNRMLYTAKTTIQEDLTIPYEDGASTLFFYINGEPEDVPEPVQQMLAYFESSDESRAVNPTLDEIHRMLSYIRHDEIVEDTYMKWFEREDMIRDEGREEGREEGEWRNLISLVCKKLVKGKTIPEIAEALETDEETIQSIVSLVEPFKPEYDIDAILAAWKTKQG